MRIGSYGRLQIRSKLHLGTKKVWAVYEGVSIDAGSPIIIRGKLPLLKQPKILGSVQKVYHSYLHHFGISFKKFDKCPIFSTLAAQSADFF